MLDAFQLADAIDPTRLSVLCFADAARNCRALLWPGMGLRLPRGTAIQAMFLNHEQP